MSLLLCLIAIVAAAIGGMLRFAITSLIARRWGVQFPLATLLINASGALFIGLFAVLLTTHPDLSKWALLVSVGFLGSYTTVSSFSLQTLSLWQSHHYQQALLNVVLSFGLCLGLVFAGFNLGKLIW